MLPQRMKRATLVLLLLTGGVAGCGGGGTPIYSGDDLVGDEAGLRAYCSTVKADAAAQSLSGGSLSASQAEVDEAMGTVDTIIRLLRDEPDAKIEDDPAGRTIKDYAVDQADALDDECDEALARRLQRVIDSVS